MKGSSREETHASSTLESVNDILEKGLHFFSSNPGSLTQILKKSDEPSSIPIHPMFESLMRNPNISFPSIQEKPHEIIDILNQAFFSKKSDNKNQDKASFPIQLSEKASKAILQLQQSKIHDKEVNVDDIVKKMIKNGLQEEAKLIHHLFHLGYLIAAANKDSAHYKATLAQTSTILSAWLIKMISKNDKEEQQFHKNKALKAIFNANVIHNIQHALENKNKLNHFFEKAYPTQENLPNSEPDNKKVFLQSFAPESKPSQEGNVHWIKRCWHVLRSLSLKVHNASNGPR